MATNFSPCKGSYVLNQFPSNVMFGMNGFHVSASGAIQGHHGPLVFYQLWFGCALYGSWPSAAVPLLKHCLSTANHRSSQLVPTSNLVCITEVAIRATLCIAGIIKDT